jgi:hypothetical protein
MGGLVGGRDDGRRSIPTLYDRGVTRTQKQHLGIDRCKQLTGARRSPLFSPRRVRRWLRPQVNPAHFMLKADLSRPKRPPLSCD